MNGCGKITSAHRDRLAVIYLRQSSMAQVREHTESTTRQYGLAEEAVQLGWARLDVLVIDTDLGVSGRWGVIREGFTELVRRVCSGQVGAIFGMEISRLARSSAEVARLMEFAAITETLLIDADGVYDPGDVNDRMLARLEGNDGRGGAACDGAAAAGQQAGRGRARRAAHPVAGRVRPRRARRSDRRPRRRGPGRDLRPVRRLRRVWFGLRGGRRVRRSAVSAARLRRRLGGAIALGCTDSRPGA